MLVPITCSIWKFEILSSTGWGGVGWGGGLYIACIIFDLEHVKVIWGSFSALFREKGATLKWLIIE